MDRCADRNWFEVENKKYHVRGYVTTHGLDAWIIYSGYRRSSTPDPLELSVALRSVETIAPIMNAPTTQPALRRSDGESAFRTSIR